MNLLELSYPVFKLREEKPSIMDDVCMYVYYDEEGKFSYNVIDDKSIEGDTLGKRRLKLKLSGVKLHRLSKAIFFLGDLIKISKSNLWFIDSKGKVFDHKKSARTLLKFHKIDKVIPITSGGAIIQVENINTRFKTLYAPTEDKTYAGILHYHKSLILYGLYEEKHKDTWRVV